MPEIIRALDELGWQLPTPIQQEAVPLILGGGDVLGAAETGFLAQLYYLSIPLTWFVIRDGENRSFWHPNFAAYT